MNRKIIFSPNEFYHVYNRGVDKRIIFLDNLDRERFIKLLYLANSSEKFNFNDILRKNHKNSIFNLEKGDELVSIGAWCLMQNHFHLLLKEKLEVGPQVKSGISLFMQKLLTAYSMYFNTKYNRKGSLFEGKFKAQHLDYDQYLKYQFTYIHLNPIGIIDNGWKNKNIKNLTVTKKFLDDYSYSSLFDYSGHNREEKNILNKKDFPKYFMNKEEFKDMINEWLNFSN